MRPSVIVPAHDEERAIGRTLRGMLADADAEEFDVVVVANGCSDRTATVAAEFGGVKVIETPVASKAHALRLGDEHAGGFPRVYLDADVEITAESLRELCVAVSTGGALAAGPARDVPMQDVSGPVRWYYDVWLQLPAVRDELFGRGVIAVSEAGHARLGGIADVMSDDLAATVAFAPDECRIVPEAVAVIRPPRTYGDLMRRRVRAMAGNRQLGDATSAESDAVESRRAAPRNSLKDVVRIGVRQPWQLPKVAVFVGTALVSRLRARRFLRADGTTWLRDESSRAG